MVSMINNQFSLNFKGNNKLMEATYKSAKKFQRGRLFTKDVEKNVLINDSINTFLKNENIITNFVIILTCIAT